MIDRVAALYIDPRGPYPVLVADCWDETRDAKLYAGPWPVVAHPPCGPWGRLRHLSRFQDPTCGPRGVEQVRLWGGVLEHPAGSKLWEHCGLPKPGDPPDLVGGRTFEIEQVRFGHVARKRTWLYVVGTDDIGPMPPEREPTHWIAGGRNRNYPGKYQGHRGYAPEGIKFCSAEKCRRTPPLFAEWLVNLAARCDVVKSAREQVHRFG